MIYCMELKERLEDEKQNNETQSLLLPHSKRTFGRDVDKRIV
jgi:hypothetical protein